MNEQKKITNLDIEKVAGLARLGLTSEEKAKIGGQLNDILVYMEKLDELETAEVEPLAHILPLRNVLREDEIRVGLDQDLAMLNAPEKKDGFFKVPPVIE
jgi:aspartyl-tRNA(Asn)/glutamyl-tRNA(Gln) amidotransferase subunit C